MQNKSITLVCAIIVLLIIGTIVFIIRGSEDTWIRDEKGVWITHGHPSNTPENVKVQQEAIQKAQELYNQEKNKGINFTSQCLGTSEDYAIDIVHVPRTSEDDIPENQCEDYMEKRVFHFIELSQNGSIVRVY